MTGAALDPALDRALRAARDRRERRGAAGDATVVVADLAPDEALALDGLLSLSRRSPVLPGTTLRVSLSALEAALRACGSEPREEYERVGGRPLRDLPAQRAARRELRCDFGAWLRSHEVARARPEIGPWLERALRQGRIHAEMRPLVAQALAIVAALPAQPTLQRTVLAARMLDGDPHGLDVGTALHALTVALLAAVVDLPESTSAREVWARWGVLVDPVSSTVAALNLPLVGDGIAARLVRSARGTPVVLTHGQLAAGDLRWPGGVACFSCENPSVLIAAEHALGAACPPLICTGGRPSDAVRLVLAAIHRAGATIRHHGDFDESGVQILRDLSARYDARPWRFDVGSLDEALRRRGRPTGSVAAATLEDAVRTLSSAVPEELLIDDLLGDLRTPTERRSAP